MKGLSHLQLLDPLPGAGTATFTVTLLGKTLCLSTCAWAFYTNDILYIDFALAFSLPIECQYVRNKEYVSFFGCMILLDEYAIIYLIYH